MDGVATAAGPFELRVRVVGGNGKQDGKVASGNTKKGAARLLPLESSARRCSGSKFSARRGLPSKGEARALHHRPCPSI
jgi:hypothetical protein